MWHRKNDGGDNTIILRVTLVYLLLNFLIMVQKADVPISIARLILSQTAAKEQKTKMLKTYHTVIW